MTNWSRIRTDVDNDRPAYAEEVDACDYCGNLALKDELRPHLEEQRCKDCCFRCPICIDVAVYNPNDFCETCALWAMGVEF